MDNIELIRTIKEEITEPIIAEVKTLSNIITGNGDVGVCERVRNLEHWRKKEHDHSKRLRGFLYTVGAGVMIKLTYNLWMWLSTMGG